MAVLCPTFDPTCGWYIIIREKNGTTWKKLLKSPLFYYHNLGVKPPVGAKFSLQEQLQYYAYTKGIPVVFSIFPPVTASTFSQAPQIPPIPTSSQAAALGMPQLDNYYNDFQEDPFLLPYLDLSSMNSSIYDPPLTTIDIYSKLSDFTNITMSDLNEYLSSLYGFPYQFGSSPSSSYTSWFPFPKSKLTIGSNLPPPSLASSTPSILDFLKSKGFKSSMPHLSQSTMSNSFMKKYGNLQAPMPHSPKSSSGYKYKYTKLKPSMSNLSQPSVSSSSKDNYNSMNLSSSFFPMSDDPQPSTSTGTKPKSYKYNLHLPSSASSKSFHDLTSLPSTSSGTGQKLPPIGTPCPNVSASATISSSVNENLMPSPRYEHPDVVNEMNVDENTDEDVDEFIDEINDEETMDTEYKMYEEE